jgi:hypothetical protein
LDAVPANVDERAVAKERVTAIGRVVLHVQSFEC